MNIQTWRGIISALTATAILVGLPLVSFAVSDIDQDGIDDALETGTPPSPLVFNNVPYPPCTPTAQRNTCLLLGSPDIFVYLVTTDVRGGFLAQNGFITVGSQYVDVSVLFQFITAAHIPDPNATGKFLGLGVGVHVAVVTSAPANRAVGSLGQQAVVMTVDESPSYFLFGNTPEGTPSNPGKSTIWPVYVKNFVTQNVTGGVDNSTLWKKYIQNTASHELGHAIALTAAYNSKLGQYHYPSGSGTVMDDKIICSSKTQTCNVYTDYATGDRPCLLALISPTTNPLQCTLLPPPPPPIF